jgi:Ca2+-binding EF-hand superfamily protein
MQIKSFTVENISISRDELKAFLKGHKPIRYNLPYGMEHEEIDRVIEREFDNKNKGEISLTEFIEGWFWRKMY